tara:strand:- start:1446 stop:2111 length:666 start_codon:yes stop_codon:yes gene_type:complete
MKYKHIVWDWNGTLLDDRWLCIESINHILKSRKMALVSNEKYRNLFCFPVIKYYEKLGFDFTIEHFPIPEFLEYYKNGFEKCNLHNDAEFVLRRIKELGFTQSILSAGKQNSLIRWVKHHKIEKMFSHLIGIDNEKADGKIEAGISWLKNSDFSSEHILLIGDTIHDSEVSKAMGVECILIDIGHVSTYRLKKTGHKVFSSLKSVLEYLTIEDQIKKPSLK